MDEQRRHEPDGFDGPDGNPRGVGTVPAEEWREPEPGQLERVHRYTPGQGGPAGVRGDLAAWLSDADFPATPYDLMRHAERMGAPRRGGHVAARAASPPLHDRARGVPGRGTRRGKAEVMTRATRLHPAALRAPGGRTRRCTWAGSPRGTGPPCGRACVTSWSGLAAPSPRRCVRRC
ncbi:DUF2795 domain-containing protein [Nonomuraea ferruginea]